MNEHTPIPWSLSLGKNEASIYEGMSGTIANIPDDLNTWQANANFVVKACNSYDVMLRKLKKISAIHLPYFDDPTMHEHLLGAFKECILDARETLNDTS